MDAQSSRIPTKQEILLAEEYHPFQPAATQSSTTKDHEPYQQNSPTTPPQNQKQKARKNNTGLLS